MSTLTGSRFKTLENFKKFRSKFLLLLINQHITASFYKCINAALCFNLSVVGAHISITKSHSTQGTTNFPPKKAKRTQVRRLAPE